MLIVYGKLKTDKRFKPMDMKNNVLVNNKIYASLFTEEEREALEKEVEAMNELNPDYIFEIRETK